jgi:hypothetical protein
MAKWRNRLLLLDIESTYGTAPSMDGTDAILVPEIEIVPLEVELKDRELITGYFGNTEKIVSMQMSKATISVEYSTSGALGVAPKWGPMMRACGFSQTISSGVSVLYEPVSEDQESVAFVFFADGVKHTLRGARGTWSLNKAVSEIPRFQYEFTALYTQATDDTRPTATYTNQAKPLALNSRNTGTVEIFGFDACLEAMTLDLANEVNFRQNAGCSELVEINDRKPSGTLKIEAPTIAQKDYFSALGDQDLGEVNIIHGQAGNRLTLSMGACNLGSIGYSESNKVIMLDMAYMPNPITGNDEISLLLD